MKLISLWEECYLLSSEFLISVLQGKNFPNSYNLALAYWHPPKSPSPFLADFQALSSLLYGVIARTKHAISVVLSPANNLSYSFSWIRKHLSPKGLLISWKESWYVRGGLVNMVFGELSQKVSSESRPLKYQLLEACQKSFSNNLLTSGKSFKPFGSVFEHV